MNRQDHLDSIPFAYFVDEKMAIHISQQLLVRENGSFCINSPFAEIDKNAFVLFVAPANDLLARQIMKLFEIKFNF